MALHSNRKCCNQLLHHPSECHNGCNVKTLSRCCYMNVCAAAYVCEQRRKNQCSALMTLCAENLPVTGGFPAQRVSNMESVSMSIIIHVYINIVSTCCPQHKYSNSLFNNLPSVLCHKVSHRRFSEDPCRPWARGVHHAPPPHIPTKLCFSEPSECPQ